MRRIVVTLLMAIALVVPLGLVGVSQAPKAEASWVCDVYGICGDVKNVKRSKCNLIVSNDWSLKNNDLAGLTLRLKPGRWAPFYDNDGFKPVPGCWMKYTFNNGLTWSKRTTKAVKINDATNAKVVTKPRSGGGGFG